MNAPPREAASRRARLRAGLGARLRAHRTALRRGAVIAFALLVAALLAQQAREVQWDEVVQAMRGYRAPQLAAAAALAALAYLLYACYDVLGKFYAGHPLSVARSMAVAYVSYAFNLNLGSLVGGVGFRYRLYGKLGLDVGTITRVLGFSLVTNWLGYLWVAGAIFASGTLDLPPDWAIDSAMLRVLGALLLAAAAAYVAACGLARRRRWQVHGHAVELPSLRVAALQSLLAAASWSTIGLVLHTLMPAGASYALVLGVLLVSGIAGAATHIPGGLGVVEAVFVMLLGARLPRGELFAALLAYRAVYYLLPLAAAAVLYAAMEAQGRRGRVRGAARPEGRA